MLKKRPALINGLLSLLIIVMLLAYPFVIYHWADKLNSRWFGGMILAIFWIRFIFLNKTKHRNDKFMLGVISLFCLCVMTIESQTLLLVYPVIMNIGMGMTFISSLTEEQCLIEKFARLGGKVPPPEAHSYIRKLTLLWGLLLITNGLISAYTVWYTSLSFWTFYNGLFAYLLMLCFAVGEWVYRGYYKKKHNIINNEK